jgi:hypothetical protein
MSKTTMNAACQAQLVQIHQQLEQPMTASQLQEEASVDSLDLQKSAKRAYLLSTASAPALDKDVILDAVFS